PEISTIPLHDALPIYQHAFAYGSGHGVVAGQRAHLAVEHDMAGGQLAHHFERIGIAVADALVGHVVAVGIPGHIEVLLAHIVDPDRKSTRLNSSHVKI